MKVDEKKLHEVRAAHSGKKIVVCTGGFDLTHAGHALFFEDCKNAGDILVVGIASDATRRKERGPSRPVLNEHLRAKMVDTLKPVDYVFVITDLAQEGEDKMAPVDRMLERLQPDVWALNEDAYDIPRRKKLAEKLGIELLILPRTCPPEFENISTTSIIEKIQGGK
jgi:cytidyltransferase-like protein